MRKLFLFSCLAMAQVLHAQDTLQEQQLNEVTVNAFEQQGYLPQVAASVNAVGRQELDRYGDASIVSAVNSLPGVRMEERSPGSYRLSVRGSSLRAPFGVRNVKVYYNDIPFTDPGGTTYLNQLGYYNFQSINILKGPGSSLYGAGTGGVALIHSLPADVAPGARVAFTGGSYGMTNALGEVRLAKPGLSSSIRYQDLRSDGYRAQSAMRRSVLSWDLAGRIDTATSFDAHFLYSDLYYQTPGALTLKEYDADPRMARPGTAAAPGAIAANAAIYQKMLLAGFTLRHHFGHYWQAAGTAYGYYAQLYNPGIRNYGKSSEPNAGGRAVIRYDRPLKRGDIHWVVGAELQQNFTTQQTYRNVGGNPDTLQTDELAQNQNLFFFTQGSAHLGNWTLTAGLSLSRLKLRYARLSSTPYQEQVLRFNNELSPRISLLKNWSRAINTYATVGRGFSPPTTSELSPSGGVLNAGLQAEYGWNYELGLRGHLFGHRLYYDADVYYARLSNTIVQRRDAQGGDYYLNSGATAQPGAELYLRYLALQRQRSSLSIWASYTAQQYRYREFRQLDADYSGNRMPGVAPNTLAAGIDVQTKSGIYGNVNYYYSDAFALNDANTDINAAWHLLGARVGYKTAIAKRGSLDIFAGGENLLDAKYSAGPDINAFGGRYYNAAAGRNFFAGISLGYQ